MSDKRKIQMSINLLMVIMLPMLMAHSLIGETFHEAAGTAMFILFIAHNISNYKWYKAIFKGRYMPYRILLTAVNMLLFVIMLLLPISGIIISKHIYTFINIDGKAFWRNIHMSAAYWGYVLMSFYMGLHLDKVLIKRVSLPVYAAIAFVFLYGIYAFITKNIYSYMFLNEQFVYFDHNEPIILFLVDYASVMIFFALIGCFTGKILINIRKRKGGDTFG